MTGGKRWQPTWIFGRQWDVFITLSWLPVFVASHILVHLPGALGLSMLRHIIVLALLISFLHQPLTFGLIYGDAAQIKLHRRLFVVAPMLAIAVAVVAAVNRWWIVIPVAAIWNLQHTLQQRYGIERIYAGRSGYGSARLDRAISYVPMVAVLAAVAALPGTESLATRASLDPMNAGAIHLLVTVRPVATVITVFAGLATLVVLAAAVRQEVDAGSKANPAKWFYQLSSIAMLVAIVVDPAAGFIAYVASHALEYAVVVDRTAKRRYAGGVGVETERRHRSLLSTVATHAPGRVGFFVLIVLGSLAAYTKVRGPSLNAIVYTVGALHFTYDAVIWKLRKPVVAKDFAIAPREATLARS